MTGLRWMKWGCLGAVFLFWSCGEGDEPASTSPVVGAPSIASPATGSAVEERRPTLTVSNASVSNGTATYSFQVATDSGFTSIVAQTQGVGQGSAQTSWQVSTDLENRQYFWRARARAGSTDGPYSSVADFRVNAPGFGSLTPVNGVLVYDPLTNGTTVGQRGGGEFTPQGWMITTRSDYIRYGVPTVESGYVEWENGNMEDEVEEKQWMLFGMWDPSKGGYRENPFRVNLQKLDTKHNSPFFRMRWISNGELYDFGNDFVEWDLFKTYKIRVEWGPGIGSQVVKVFLDGQEAFSQTYDNIYRPSTHWIELGIQERKESIIGVVYSNVKIGVR